MPSYDRPSQNKSPVEPRSDPSAPDLVQPAGNAAVQQTVAEHPPARWGQVGAMCYDYAANLAPHVYGAATSELQTPLSTGVDPGRWLRAAYQLSRVHQHRNGDATQPGDFAFYGGNPEMHTSTVLQGGPDPIVAESSVDAPMGRTVPLSKSREDVGDGVMRSFLDMELNSITDENLADAQLALEGMPVEFVAYPAIRRAVIEAQEADERSRIHDPNSIYQGEEEGAWQELMDQLRLGEE